MKHGIFFLFVLIAVSACGIRIEKRLYRNGFTISRAQYSAGKTAQPAAVAPEPGDLSQRFEPQQADRQRETIRPVSAIESPQALTTSSTVAVDEPGINKPPPAESPAGRPQESEKAAVKPVLQLTGKKPVPEKYRETMDEETRAGIKLLLLVLLYLLLLFPLIISLYFLAYMESILATVVAFAFIAIYIGSFIFFVIRIFRNLRIRKAIQSSRP